MSRVVGPFCPLRVSFRFRVSPERVPSYLVTDSFPLNDRFTSKETLSPSLFPLEISVAAGAAPPPPPPPPRRPPPPPNTLPVKLAPSAFRVNVICVVLPC